ncbi:unnamed protein product [Trichobilharzia szidati]|nr:unnamed protein product [Trichobilharzia szidati]
MPDCFKFESPFCRIVARRRRTMYVTVKTAEECCHDQRMRKDNEPFFSKDVRSSQSTRSQQLRILAVITKNNCVKTFA